MFFTQCGPWQGCKKKATALQKEFAKHHMDRPEEHDPICET